MDSDRGDRSMLAISGGVVFRKLDGESVILNLDSGTYFGLDRLGTRIWQLIEEHGCLSEVNRSLLDEYDVSPSTLETDVSRLVSTLVEKGLLVRSDVQPETS